MNLSDLRTEVFELIGDDATAPKQYTTAEVDRYINDAQREIARESRAIEHHLFIDTVAEQGEYTLPDYISEVLRVTYDNERILPATVHELDRYDTTWRDRTGTPFVYHIDRLNDTIGLYPAPSASSGTAMETDLGTVVDFGTDDSLTQDEGGTYDTFTFATEYGVIVDIPDHTFSQEPGTIVRVSGDSIGLINDDPRTAEHGITVRIVEEEWGLVADVDESGRTHLFVDEEGDPFDQYSPSAEVGLIVRIPDHTFLADDGRDIDTFQYVTSEYGITTDIYASSTSSVADYALSVEPGAVVRISGGATGTFDSEYGIPVLISGRTPSDDNKDTGVTVQIAGGSDDYTFSGEYGLPVYLAQGEYGVLIDYNDAVNNVEVWATKDPDDMTADNDEPELPNWTHQAIAHMAASRAMMKEAETKNPASAQACVMMARVYIDHLRKMVVERTPNKITHMGQLGARPLSRQRPRLPGEFPDVWRR